MPIDLSGLAKSNFVELEFAETSCSGEDQFCRLNNNFVRFSQKVASVSVEIMKLTLTAQPFSIIDDF